MMMTIRIKIELNRLFKLKRGSLPYKSRLTDIYIYQIYDNQFYQGKTQVREKINKKQNKKTLVK